MVYRKKQGKNWQKKQLVGQILLDEMQKKSVR